MEIIQLKTIESNQSLVKPKYHLMEISSEMISLFENKINKNCNEQEQEQQLCIKGRLNDEAVLCSNEKTFLLQQVSQSNSLLLCSIDKEKENNNSLILKINDTLENFFELIPIVALTNDLKNLLKDSEYFGEENELILETNKEIKFYNFQQIQSVIRASKEEILQSFNENFVLNLNNFYRKISKTYLKEALEIIINYIDRLNLSLNRILLNPIISFLKENHDMNEKVSKTLLTIWFGELVSTAEEEQEKEQFIKLNSKSIITFLGLELLKSKAMKNQILISNFLKQWNEIIGETLKNSIREEEFFVNEENSKEQSLNEQMLNEKHLIWLNGNFITFPLPPNLPSHILYFNSLNLPIEISKRFKILFLKRSKWLKSELIEFIKEISIDSKKIDSLLLKFTKTSTYEVPLLESKQEKQKRLQNGIKQPPIKKVIIYSSRLRY